MPEPGNYTRIPNIIEEDERIDASAFRVYAHYRRKAGEAGYYRGGVRETSESCHLSQPTVIKAKRLLVETGYICVGKHHRDDGQWVDSVTITDVWEENRARFQKPSMPTDALNNESASEADGGTRSIPKAGALNSESATRSIIEARSISEAISLNNESDLAKKETTSIKNPRKNQGKNQIPLAVMMPEELPDDLPEQVAAFMTILRQHPTFNGQASFARKVAKDYMMVDLEELAISAISWLAKHPDRPCSTQMLFKWLKDEKAKAQTQPSDSRASSSPRSTPPPGTSPPARAAPPSARLGDPPGGAKRKLSELLLSGDGS